MLCSVIILYCCCRRTEGFGRGGSRVLRLLYFFCCTCIILSVWLSDCLNQDKQIRIWRRKKRCCYVQKERKFIKKMHKHTEHTTHHILFIRTTCSRQRPISISIKIQKTYDMQDVSTFNIRRIKIDMMNYCMHIAGACVHRVGRTRRKLLLRSELFVDDGTSTTEIMSFSSRNSSSFFPILWLSK